MLKKSFRPSARECPELPQIFGNGFHSFDIGVRNFKRSPEKKTRLLFGPSRALLMNLPVEPGSLPVNGFDRFEVLSATDLIFFDIIAKILEFCANSRGIGRRKKHSLMKVRGVVIKFRTTKVEHDPGSLFFPACNHFFQCLDRRIDSLNVIAIGVMGTTIFPLIAIFNAIFSNKRNRVNIR